MADQNPQGNGTGAQFQPPPPPQGGGFAPPPPPPPQVPQTPSPAQNFGAPPAVGMPMTGANPPPPPAPTGFAPQPMGGSGMMASQSMAQPYAPQQPMGQQPAGQQPPGQQPPPPPVPGPPANFQLGKLLPPELKLKVPAHSLQVDEKYFLRLLAGSISLTKDEKRRIVDSIPKLRQAQIDELTRIFEEERRKFAELGQEHTPQLEKLAKQHYEDWMDLEMEEQQKGKKEEETSEADALRKKLGLS